VFDASVPKASRVMSETTPLVCASHGVASVATTTSVDPEDSQGFEKERANERTARALAARVFWPFSIAALLLAMAIVAATYRHSDGFERVKRAVLTTKGVDSVDAAALSSVGVCDAAFARSRAHTGEKMIASLVAGGAERVYVRALDERGGTCDAAPSAAQMVMCVDAEKVLKCAEEAGVVLPDDSIRNRYVLATIITHARASELRNFAYYDARDGLKGAMRQQDERALKVLLDSENWQTVRLQYDAHISVVQEVETHHECPHHCKCTYAEGKLCQLHSNKCALEQDSIFILRSNAFEDVLRHLPNAINGVSSLKELKSQWLMVPPFQTSTPQNQASLGAAPGEDKSTASLGLPVACVEPATPTADAPLGHDGDDDSSDDAYISSS